ncbi:MAG TPA: dihydrofolate reductase family protein [Gemmatimonadaceae bacterium]|nr:dihydrofolate reductase family protein [Gemmatimonadaceae bacterium]
MRIVTYGAACSLDGFIAAADGGIDWLHFSRDVQDIMATYWATIDTVLMGRKTWDFAATQQGGGGGSDGGRRTKRGPAKGGRTARGRRGPTTYVFSRTLTEDPAPGVRLVSSDPGAFVRELKAQPGKGICVMGGGELARSLLEADVIDEVGLNVHPILLGTGVPLFRDAGRRIPLELIESRTIDGGCVYATYRVRHAS